MLLIINQKGPKGALIGLKNTSFRLVMDRKPLFYIKKL